MHAHDEPDQLQRDVDVAHVHGRHHHDHHHHDVPEGYGDDSQHRAAVAPQVLDAVAQPRLRDLHAVVRVLRERPREEVRVGPQEHRQREHRDREHEAGLEVRAGELREAEAHGDGAGDPEQVGPEDGADRAGPDDERQRPRAVGRLGEVGRGVAGLQARGRRDPHEEAAEEHERQRPRGAGDHDDHRADRGDAVAEGERGATPAVERDAREREGEDGGAEDPHGLREPRRGVRPERRSDEGSRRHRPGDRDPPEHRRRR